MSLTSSCNMSLGSSGTKPLLNLVQSSSVAQLHGTFQPSNIQVQVDGTATSPSVSWGNDSTTGMFHPADHTLSLSTQGTERIRIAPSGNLGIHTASPAYPVHINSDVCIEQMLFVSNVVTDSQVLPMTYNNASLPSYSWSNNSNTGMYLHRTNQIAFSADGNSTVYIGSNIGIGTDAPNSSACLHVNNTLPVFFEQNGTRTVLEGDATGCYFRTASNGGNIKAIVGGVGGVILQTFSNATWRDRATFGQNGNMQLWGTSPNGINTALAIECIDNAYRLRTMELNKTLILNGSSNIVFFPDTQNIYKMTLTNQGLRFSAGGSAATPSISWDTAPTSGVFADSSNVCIAVNGVERARITDSSLIVNGDFTAISKNFMVQHPIKYGYKLVHASVEAPRYDLLYRGSTQLYQGHATVDLDVECNNTGGMSPGTFEALVRDCQVFLQNNTPTSWDMVKGYVDKNKLEIVSNNPNSSDTIDWLVVGERKDPSLHYSMYATPDRRLMTEIRDI